MPMVPAGRSPVSGVRCARQDPHGNWFAAGKDDGTVFFRAMDEHQDITLPSIQAHSEAVNAIGFHPDSMMTVVSGGRDRLVCITRQQSVETRLSGHTESVVAVAMSRNGLACSASRDKTVRIWSIEVHGQIGLFGLDETPTDIAMDANGQFVAVTNGKKLSTLRATDGSVLHHTTHEQPVYCVDYARDSNAIVTGSANQIRVLNAESPADVGHLRTVHKFELPQGTKVTCVQIRQDGRRILAGDDSGNVHQWDMLTGEHVSTNPTGGDYVLSVCYDKTGAFMTFMLKTDI